MPEFCKFDLGFAPFGQTEMIPIQLKCAQTADHFGCVRFLKMDYPDTTLMIFVSFVDDEPVVWMRKRGCLGGERSSFGITRGGKNDQNRCSVETMSKMLMALYDRWKERGWLQDVATMSTFISSSNHMKEFQSIRLFMDHFEKDGHFFDKPRLEGTPVDAIMDDGIRVQFKSAIVFRGHAKAPYYVSLEKSAGLLTSSKKRRVSKTTYSVDDFDLLIATLVDGDKLVGYWMIPIDDLLELNVLQENGKEGVQAVYLFPGPLQTPSKSRFYYPCQNWWCAV